MSRSQARDRLRQMCKDKTICRQKGPGPGGPEYLYTIVKDEGK